MTTNEFKNQKTLKVSKTLKDSQQTFNEGDIFEVNTIHNTITYAKIVDSWEDIFFDILECAKDGGNVRLPCRSNMVQNRTINRMIKEGHWRMYFKTLKEQNKEVLGIGKMVIEE